MQPVIDFLAEEELKNAERLVRQAFDVKQVKEVRFTMSKATRKEGKHERIARMLTNLMTVEPAPMVDLLPVVGD